MNILITGAWRNAQQHIAEIENMGHEVCFMQYEKDELPCDCDWVEGVICNGLFLYHEIEKFINLKYIQLTSAGYDRVQFEYVKEHEIEIHNAKGVYSIPMAEFALAGVLSLYKKLDAFKEQQKKHQWIKQRDLLELNGKTVCIIGCGSVGTECAKRFRAFGCRVIGLNRTIKEDSIYNKIVKLNYLPEYLPEADIVVLTLQMTEQTNHILNSNNLRLLKPTAVLVNLARGGLLDFESITRILPNIGGAVLDVFEEEPLNEDSCIWNFPNVIITPHNSFVGDHNEKRLYMTICKGLSELK